MYECLRIGIIGGGQIAKNLLPHALKSGLNVSLMDKEKNAPWAKKKSFFEIGDPMEFEDVIKFGDKLDILKVYNDKVNIAALKQLNEKGVKIYPFLNQ
jgi:5-(carboxyamino)imidazole ribonucleotide synthase